MFRAFSCFGRNVAQDVINPEDYQNPAQIPRNPGVVTKVATEIRTYLAPKQISEARFDAMPADAKIAWLSKSAPPLREGEDPPINTIQVGPRTMTRRNVLCLALDYAVKERRLDVPRICRQLTNEYVAEDLSFPVLGVPFDRNRVRDWAREGLGPGMEVSQNVEIQNLGKELYQDNGQNVHQVSVIIALADQLKAIKDRIPANLQIPPEQAEAEIKAHLRSFGRQSAAMQGFNHVLKHGQEVSHFNESIKGTLFVLWSYIQAVPDLDTRHQLKESMAAKLREIHVEKPCATGMIERIIDIPTAIDWSITQRMSSQHLRDELQRMAAVINEACDADRDINSLVEQATVVKLSLDPAGESESTAELIQLEQEITTLKRDRFLHTAHIELSILRGIDSKLVDTVAKSVFPEHISI